MHYAMKVALFIIFWFPVTLRAGFEPTEHGARPLGMAGAFVALSDNVWAPFFNPAGLRLMNWREVAVFYSPQPFGLKELAHGSISYVEPTSIGAFGFSARTYGFELYREVTATVSYANAYRNVLFYGANISYYHLSISNYGSDGTIGIDIGILAYITDYLRWGFCAINMNMPTIGQAKEKLPQVYTTGLSFNPLSELVMNLDVQKDVKYPASVRFGVEYEIFDMLALRTGVANNPSKFSAGLGVRYSIIEFDYALYTHQELGLTHQISVGISFGGEGGRSDRREAFRKTLE